MKSRMTASGGIEQKEKVLMDMDNTSDAGVRSA